MGNKIKPLWGEPLADLIRRVTERDLPSFSLMGLPEATVIAVADGYYSYKSQMTYLADNDIFKRIVRARAYDVKLEKQILDKSDNKSLYEFIEATLEAESQSGQLSRESIENIIVRYKEVRGIE